MAQFFPIDAMNNKSGTGSNIEGLDILNAYHPFSRDKYMENLTDFNGFIPESKDQLTNFNSENLNGFNPEYKETIIDNIIPYQSNITNIPKYSNIKPDNFNGINPLNTEIPVNISQNKETNLNNIDALNTKIPANIHQNKETNLNDIYKLQEVNHNNMDSDIKNDNSIIDKNQVINQDFFDNELIFGTIISIIIIGFILYLNKNK